ncbi:MAG: GTPase ObgE [Candidatus Neomarinimicrobiota bacterium]
MFIDYAQIELIAGDGGPGVVSFRRAKFVPKGGPDGGDGGDGGSIIFRVDPQLNTLQDFRYRKIYKARKGDQGGSSLKTGRSGADIVISIPPGTTIKAADSGRILADLTEPGQDYIACHGGKGGKGNANFKSATNQTPRYAQPGLPGERGVFDIELKVLADIGLVGLPNAGKSTLLSKISAARPKIADYPFTTLQPYLGIVKYGDYRSFVMADIPGLIEGASTGKGLGHQFLRHIERNRVLLYLIDVSEADPAGVFRTLKSELINYNVDLNLKKYIIVRTKMDLFPADSEIPPWDQFPEAFIDISAVTGAGLKNLVDSIVEILNAEQ